MQEEEAYTQKWPCTPLELRIPERSLPRELGLVEQRAAPVAEVLVARDLPVALLRARVGLGYLTGALCSDSCSTYGFAHTPPGTPARPSHSSLRLCMPQRHERGRAAGARTQQKKAPHEHVTLLQPSICARPRSCATGPCRRNSLGLFPEQRAHHVQQRTHAVAGKWYV